MSKRLEFFLAVEDLAIVDSALGKYGFDRFLRRSFPGPDLPDIRSLLPFQPGVDHLTMHAVRSIDLSNIRVDAINGEWFPDETHSPLITVTRCFVDAEVIRRGRLYAPTGCYEGERWVPRARDFVAAVDGALRTLRRMLTRDSALDADVGPGAREARARGIVLARG